MRAVHLHDQPRRRREEVDDIAEQHDLPPKPRAQLRAAQSRPKNPLWLGGRNAHAVSVCRELLLLVKFAVCR
jgi:hypothetical protein